MSARVDVDTRAFVKGVRQLSDGLAKRGPDTARRSADEVANRMRAATPRRSGALVSTITVVGEGDGGFGVTYGGGLRYARPVAARTGNVATAIAGVPDVFGRECEDTAAREVSRL